MLVQNEFMKNTFQKVDFNILLVICSSVYHTCIHFNATSLGPVIRGETACWFQFPMLLCPSWLRWWMPGAFLAWKEAKGLGWQAPVPSWYHSAAQRPPGNLIYMVRSKRIQRRETDGSRQAAIVPLVIEMNFFLPWLWAMQCDLDPFVALCGNGKNRICIVSSLISFGTP